MDIDLLNRSKISPNARVKIINDFFPEYKDDIDENGVTGTELDIHAGALCLYTATMLTKIYDKSEDESASELGEIKLESNDREIEMQNIIRSNPKYSHYTEDQVQEEAHKMILRDIRNSFAHGNFEIGYNPYKKNVYFILTPKRKDMDVDIPIVISQKSLRESLSGTMAKNAFKYYLLSDSAKKDVIQTNLNAPLQSLMIPTELLKITDHYLEKKKRPGVKPVINEKRFLFIQYALLIAKITYEQDDYYNIFGKDSNIFSKIALVRNANAHSNLIFSDLAKKITYVDRAKTLEESLQKSTASLLIANELKGAILKLLNDGQNPDTINGLKDRLLEEFNFLFTEEDMPEFPKMD